MIYFIQANGDGPIKIGYSGNPQARLRNLQSGHYDKLALLGTMAGDVEVEQKVQEQFATYRIRGEWFEPVSPIFDFIKRHCNRHDVNTVQLLEDGECRIIFARPLKASQDLVLLFGSHRMKLLADEELNCVLGIEGQSAVIEDFLVSQGINEQALKEFRSALEQE